MYPDGDGLINEYPDDATTVARILMPRGGRPVNDRTDVRHERREDHSEVEMERRRQRREAMVLREAEGGVEEEDIIRPYLRD